jgi:hypothetical protein
MCRAVQLEKGAQQVFTSKGRRTTVTLINIQTLG